MFADCFESFCGALIKAGNQNYRGFGFNLVEYFIKYIFGNVDVQDEYDRTFGKSTTQLEQIMKRVGLEQVKLNYINNNYIHTYEYSLNREQIEGLNALLMGKKLPISNRLLIGQATGRGGKNAMKDQAADIAFQFLKSYGIETIWSQNIKNKRDLGQNETIKKLSIRAINKARKSGYQTIAFREVDKSDIDNFIVIVLLGIKPGGIQESLDVIAVDKKVESERRNVVITQGHQIVLEHYLNSE